MLQLPDAIRRLAAFLGLEGEELIRNLIRVAVIWLVAWLGMRLVQTVATRIESAVDDGDPTTFSEREQRGHTIAQLLRSVGKVVMVLVAFLLTLDVFIDIGPLLAGAGILGLAFSFGAQSLVKDVITGFFYLLEGQFAVGDIIEVSGKSGVVERMTLRVVMLRDLEGVLHMIPNGQITMVSNMTRKWARAVVDVGVRYGSEVDRALAVLRDEAHLLATDPAWQSRFDGEPEVVGVQGLDDSAVTLRTLLRTQPGQQWAVGREFRRRLNNRFAREGIEIPFPQRTVHVRQAEAGTADPGTV
jgi:moderate conductance mechanosensitive channel